MLLERSHREQAMPKFVKDIVTEGVYNQLNPKTGKYDVKRHVTKDDLGRIVDTFKKLESKGLKVPAPWKHDKDIHTFTKIEKGDKGLLDDSTKNGGFWENLHLATNEKGKTVLRGIVEAPGDENDPNTPAGKIGTLVKDTSIYLRNEYPLTDGSDEVIKDAIMHIALVTHPIEPGQKNFEPVEDHSEVLAMSQLDVEMENDQEQGTEEVNVGELVSALRDCCKLYLPEGTTSKNLGSRLLIAVKQYQLLNAPSDDSDDTLIKVDPLIMSFDASQIEALVAANVINPKTKKPFVKEDFATKAATPEVDVKSSLMMSAIATELESERRSRYQERVSRIVANGQCTDAYAKSQLQPLVDAYKMEFNGSEVVKSPLDQLLMSLEAMPVKQAPSQETLMSHTPPDLSPEDEKAMDDEADYLASLVG